MAAAAFSGVRAPEKTSPKCASMPRHAQAISNAGGMGNLTAGNYETEEAFREAIRETRRLTDKPFMVNITLLPSVRITPEHHKIYCRVCAEEPAGSGNVSATA